MPNGVALPEHLQVSTTQFHFKLTFLTGIKRGQSFLLKKDQRKVIGRDSSSDIKINDSKASRNHAELIWLNGELIVTDLKSQNGIIVNDKKVIQAKLTKGDKLIIGHTIFKVDIDYSKETPIFNEATKAFSKAPKKSILPVLIIMIGALGFLFLTDKDEKNVVENFERRKLKTRKINNSKKLAREISQDNIERAKITNEKVKVLLQRGMREIREHNYFRALREFEDALDENPKDTQARFYKRKALEGIDQVISQYNLEARRNIASINYEKALISYCSIVKLLGSYPNDPRYLKAKTEIEKLIDEEGRELGEVHCLQEQ